MNDKLSMEKLLVVATQLIRIAREDHDGKFVLRGRDIVNYILANKIRLTDIEAQAVGEQLLSNSMLAPSGPSSFTKFVEEEFYELVPLINADEVQNSTGNNQFFVITASKCYEMKADSKREMDMWISIQIP